MGKNIVHATVVALTSIACGMQTTNQTASGPHCGEGTVEVDGTCQLAPQLDVVNGDTRASAATHWATKGYNITFYADHTGVFWQTGALACPGSCHPPTPTACGDFCVDTTANAAHCGACGSACASGQMCTSGTCVVPPPSGGPSSSPGNGSEGTTSVSGTFTWSVLGNGGILNSRTDSKPFANLTNIQGGVSDGNFSATADGTSNVNYTLASGPPCQ
jgi:hypothetical protein